MTVLLWLERAIVLVCSLFLASVFCLVVFLRYGFDSDLFAFEEWVLTVAFLLYFVGAALASHEDVHIKADIVQEYLRSERTRTIYSGFLLLFEAALAAALAVYAAEMFVNEFARWPNIPTTPVYKIPQAIPRFFIVLGFALMALHALLIGYGRLRAGLAMPRAAGAGDGEPQTADDA